MVDTNDMNPVGYTTVVIEPSRTGLKYPLYMKVEETVEDKPAMTKEGIFVPRNDIETQNVVNFVNKSREKEKLSPIGTDTYLANQDNFVKYAIGQYKITEEGKRSTDPINYYGNKFQKYMDKLKEENPTSDFTGFDVFRRPADFAFSKLVSGAETVSDYLPIEKGDFALGGELLGSLPAMAMEASAAMPGVAKVPGSVYRKVMGGGAGVVTGSALGRAGGTAVYDFINDMIRATQGIDNPSDATDPGMQALVEMRNSAMFTTMAAGLGPAFTAARPVVGKILGLGQDASPMSALAEKYGIPIGISIAATGQNLGSAAKTFGKVVGVFPLIGTLMKERQLRSLIKTKQAIGKQAEMIGDPTEFYRAQYKLMSKREKANFMKDLRANGFNSLDEAIEAEIRLNGFAPIQHMTDVGMFMHKAAEDRYRRFSYVNDLLYKSFENISGKISKPFIATQNTKNVGKLLQDRINQYKTTLDDGFTQYSPALNEVEDFIVNTLGRLPQYITPLQLRGFQRTLNNLYGKMKADTGMVNFAGSDVLAEARKALTTDLNNFAGWRQGLSPEEMIAAESAKKALLRANSVFAKMSPLYKSPEAKKFKLIDENMFSAGPELPGWNYSDELFNIVMKNKMTPQAAVDLKELIGEAAYDSVVRTWLDQGFKNALRTNSAIDIVEQIPMGAGRTKTVQVTDYAIDPDKFLRNIGYGEPGFDKMLELTGRNAKVVRENIEQLVELARKIEQADIPEAFRLIQRRFALGGVRSGIKTFSFGAAAGVGGAAAFGPTPVIAGLLARFTGDFLSSPDVLKRYSQIIDENASQTVKRTAFANIMKDFYKTITGTDRMSEFPDEFKTYEGVIENPEGFMDWLLGTGYQDSMDTAGNAGAANDYENLRYNESEKLNLASYVQNQVEESEADNIIAAQGAPTQPVDVPMPDVPSMGNENIMAAGSPLIANPRPMNKDQRAALASGDIDAALALRGQG
jgi:hypothetical protein